MYQTLSLIVQLYPPSYRICSLRCYLNFPGSIYSPAAKELTIVHRDLITVQTGIHFTHAGKVSYPRTQITSVSMPGVEPGVTDLIVPPGFVVLGLYVLGIVVPPPPGGSSPTRISTAGGLLSLVEII